MFSMAWLMFRALQQPWQSGSLKILIRGFRKCKIRPCTSKSIKVRGCQIFKFYFKLWHLVTLMQLEVQGGVLPFWKPPINISREPDCHGCCSALNVYQAMLKNCICVSRLMHRTNFGHVLIFSDMKNLEFWQFLSSFWFLRRFQCIDNSIFSQNL